MWVTLTAYFACILIGGYAGLCLGYFCLQGRASERDTKAVKRNRSRSNAESQPAATIQSEDGVSETERTAETRLRAKRRAA